MTEEQHEFVVKYQNIYDRMSQLDDQMTELKVEIEVLVKELEDLRKEELKKFKTED